MVYSYCTLAQLKAELRATQDFSASTYPTADQASTWIAEDSDEVNAISGRNWGVTAYSETLDYQGEDKLILRNAPIVSVTSVLYSPYELGNTLYGLTDTKVANTDYTVYNDEGEIAILGWTPCEGRKRIQVNYTAGFNPVPERIQKLVTKKVAKRIMYSLIAKDVNEKQSGKSVSVGSISIVKPADFGVAQFKTLIADVQELEDKLVKDSCSAYRIPTHRY